jgi:hypothetical protein
VRVCERSGGQFALLLGLDDAMAEVRPDTGEIPEKLIRLANQYNDLGRYNRHTDNGMLLPRFAYPARPVVVPDNVDDYLCNVVCVSPSTAAAVYHHHLDPDEDLSPHANFEWVTVLCVPFLESIREMELVISSESPRMFRAGPNETSSLRERAVEILAALDSAGELIAMLPEATLSPDLLGHWQALLRENPPPRDGRLTWLLIGTGPVGDSDPPPNRAVILHRDTGEIVLTQDKMHSFTLDAAQLRDWNLDGILGPQAVTEDIECGARLTICESRFGRVAIAICEDLGRVIQLGPLIREFGVSQVFAPIFAKEIVPYHWEQQASESLTHAVGTSVVVANSLAIPRLQEESASGRVRTALAVWADEVSGTSWGTSYREGFADVATDVARVIMRMGLAPHPTALRSGSLVARSPHDRRTGPDTRRTVDLTILDSPDFEEQRVSDRRVGADRRNS